MFALDRSACTLRRLNGPRFIKQGSGQTREDREGREGYVGKYKGRTGRGGIVQGKRGRTEIKQRLMALIRRSGFALARRSSGIESIMKRKSLPEKQR